MNAPKSPANATDFDSAPHKSFTFILCTSCIVLGIFVAAPYVAMFGWNGYSSQLEHWGQSGDYFGGILNPVLAFMSILAVCNALWIQSRNDANNHRLAAVMQFESLLCELLHLHRGGLEMSRAFDWKSNETIVGREAFYRYIYEIREVCDREHRKNLPFAARLKSAYIHWYDIGGHAEVGHYFRGLYHIIKRIDGAEILNQDEKTKYVKLVRAQLSVVETVLLALNAMHPKGKKFQDYITKYALLQHTDVQDFRINSASTSDLYTLYPKCAFHDPDDLSADDSQIDENAARSEEEALQSVTLQDDAALHGENPQ